MNATEKQISYIKSLIEKAGNNSLGSRADLVQALADRIEVDFENLSKSNASELINVLQTASLYTFIENAELLGIAHITAGYSTPIKLYRAWQLGELFIEEEVEEVSTDDIERALLWNISDREEWFSIRPTDAFDRMVYDIDIQIAKDIWDVKKEQSFS